MNSIKKLATTINANRGKILERTLIIGVSVVGVTLAAGLIRIKPSHEAVELLEDVAEAAKKAAE